MRQVNRISQDRLLSKPLIEEDVRRLDDFFEKIKVRYPVRESCVMPLLYAVQQVLGFLSKEGIEYVAEKTGMSPAHVLEIGTFYTMFHLKPVGKYHIQVCRTASCYFCGGNELIEFVRNFVGKEEFQPTDDGLFSWELVECIGSCGTAPAVIINDRLFESVSINELRSLLERIKIEQPDLRLDIFSDEFTSDFSDLPFSKIIEASKQE